MHSKYSMTKSFPHIIKGELFKDNRGKLFSCNKFDMTSIKRMYSIENFDSDYIRGWKGHKIETRWFFASKGSIILNTTSISDLENSHSLPVVKTFKLNQDSLDVLVVPPGFATSIKQYSNGDRINVFSDYKIGVSGDEDLRWNI